MFEERSQGVGTGEKPGGWLGKEHPRQRSTKAGGESMLASIQRTGNSDWGGEGQQRSECLGCTGAGAKGGGDD